MKLKDHRALSTQNTHMSTCDLGSDWLLQRSCLVPRKQFQPIRAQSFSPNGPWFRSLKDLVSICCLHVLLRLQKTETRNISFPLLVESGRPQPAPQLVLFPLILLSTEQTLRPSCGCLLPLLLPPPPLHTAGINTEQPGIHTNGCHSLELVHPHTHALTGEARRKSEDGLLILHASSGDRW